MLSRMIDFRNAVDDVTGGQYKVLKRDYLSEGRIPVIDQGHTFIAGYANNDDAIFNGKLPVVLFGDHTLVLKYVDFPFALGADGVKVLSINNSHVPKYVYYYWQSCDIQSRGYSRHFKYLRDIQIPLIPISEQRRIVEILDQADALRKKRAEADAKAARILPALFYKMFGDPATNPKGWPFKNLGEVTIGKPQYGANASAAEWSNGMPRYVRITDITDDGRLMKSGIVTLDLDIWEPYRLADGDLLFARSGNTVGKTYLYRQDDGICAFAGYLIRFQADAKQVEPRYLFSLTQTGYYKNWIEARKRVAGQPNINGREYASLQIPCPPISLQQQFIKIAETIISFLSKCTSSAERLDSLFNVMLCRAFTADLTAKWREAHMKELLAEMKAQTKLINHS